MLCRISSVIKQHKIDWKLTMNSRQPILHSSHSGIHFCTVYHKGLISSCPSLYTSLVVHVIDKNVVPGWSSLHNTCGVKEICDLCLQQPLSRPRTAIYSRGHPMSSSPAHFHIHQRTPGHVAFRFNCSFTGASHAI